MVALCALPRIRFFFGLNEGGLQSLDFLIEPGEGRGKPCDQSLFRAAIHGIRNRRFADSALGQLVYIGSDCRKDILFRHIQHCRRLNMKGLAIVFQQNLITGVHFRFRKDMMLGKQRDIFLADKQRQGIDSGFQI